MENSFGFLVSLWKNYNNASLLLTKAMKGTANEVGEFAEILVANYYKGEQLTASNKSADIKTDDARLVQVKSRKIEKIKSTSLNVIRSWDFDLLVVVLFNKEGDILKAIEIDSRIAEKLAKYDKNQNGKILTTNNNLLNNKDAKDITTQLQNVLDGREQDTFNIKETLKHKKEDNNESIRENFPPPEIELYPDNVNIFRASLLKTKRAKRTWYYANGEEKAEIWNASNLSESSNIYANIKTTNNYRRWKELKIIKVKLEVLQN